MKKGILFIAMLMICSVSKSQVLENNFNSRLESLERLTKNLNEINKHLGESNHILTSNLAKYQKQRKRGIGFVATGLMLSTLGYTAMISSSDFDDSAAKTGVTALAVLGGTSSLIGTVIILDSGKWLTNKKRHKGNYIDIEYSK